MNYHNIVLSIAVALGAIGFLCAGSVAYLQYQLNGDLVYVGILTIALIVLAFLFRNIKNIYSWVT